MKNTLYPHVHAPHGEASDEQKERTYSLLETAQVMGLSLPDLGEILKRHELHTEPSPRGARVSRREVFNYVSRRPTAVAEAGRGISP
jgi:hypothetical protein